MSMVRCPQTEEIVEQNIAENFENSDSELGNREGLSNLQRSNSCRGTLIILHTGSVNGIMILN
jgi:hypothetical protein